MNILILKFPYSSLYGGGERHTLSLVQGLKDRGHDVFLYSTCKVLLQEFQKRGWSAHNMFMPREPVSKWTIFTFPFVAPYAFVRLSLLLLTELYRHDIRAVYCLSLLEKILITPVARLLRMKVIWVEHVEPDRWLSMNPFRSLYIRDSRRATVVVISNVIKTKLMALGVLEDRIRVIYNGIDLDQIPKKIIPPSGSPYVIGVVGRLEAEKGIDVLVNAFAQLVEHAPHCKLVVVGDGSERASLEWLAEKRGVKALVQFVGFQPHVQSWISSFDVLVLPSVKRESFGLVLVEALASGVPVIASDLGGIPEIIEDRVTGILVPPADANVLFEALLWSVRHRDRMASLAERGRAMVRQRFTLGRMIDEFEAVLKQKG